MSGSRKQQQKKKKETISSLAKHISLFSAKGCVLAHVYRIIFLSRSCSSSHLFGNNNNIK
jgi:hypothetical protein